MKICQYCNHKSEDSVSICPSCGSNQFYSELELQKRQDQLRAEEEKWKVAEDAQKQRARRLLGTVFAIAIVVVAAFSIISYIKTSKPYRDAGISRSEVNQLLKQGSDLFENGNYQEAIELFLRIPKEVQEYEEAQVFLRNSINEYREYVKSSTQSLISQDYYESAYSLVAKAHTLLPEDSEIDSLYADIYSRFKSAVINKAHLMAEEGNYLAGIDVLSEAMPYFSSDASFHTEYDSMQSQYKEAIKKTAIEQAERYESEGNYPDALAIINSAIEEIGSSGELMTRLNQLENGYVNKVISNAEIAYSESGYASAISIINEGLGVLPENAVLQDKAQYYFDHKPFSVWSLDYFTIDDHSSDYKIITEDKDNYGNTMNNILAATWTGGIEKDILLNKEYSRLVGTLYRSYESRDASYSPHLRIQCDGSIVFDKSIEVGEKPVSFDIDLTNVDVVDIYLWNVTYDGFVYTAGLSTVYKLGGVSDFLIYKK